MIILQGGERLGVQAGLFTCALRLSICAKERVTSCEFMCVFRANSIILISCLQVEFTSTFNCYDTIACISLWKLLLPPKFPKILMVS